MDLTSGRWPRWVARYDKGGGQSTSGPIYEKWGGGGGGQFASGPLRKVGGGGGDVSPPIRSPRSFASRDPHHISGP